MLIKMLLVQGTRELNYVRDLCAVCKLQRKGNMGHLHSIRDLLIRALGATVTRTWYSLLLPNAADPFLLTSSGCLLALKAAYCPQSDADPQRWPPGSFHGFSLVRQHPFDLQRGDQSHVNQSETLISNINKHMLKTFAVIWSRKVASGRLIASLLSGL